jgi:tetratricopeptide (TPR) repeat protein
MSQWFDAEHAAERAHELYEAGQWDQALEHLNQALEVNPHQSEWHFGKGLTLDALCRYGEAADAFAKVIDLRGEDEEVLLRLGVDLLRSEQPQRAIDALERLAGLNPDCEPAFCHLILAYALNNEHERAEEMFYRAQQLTENCPRCFDHLAQSLAMRREWARSAQCWRRVVDLDRHFPCVHANLARCYWQLDLPQSARDHFVLHLRQEPGDTVALMHFGILLLILGQIAEAREKFARVVELDPTIADAHYQLGLLALTSGHLDAAAAELEITRQLAPNEAGIHLALAQVAQRRGQVEPALTHLTHELELDGQTPAQVMRIATLTLELDSPQIAIDLLAPLLDPDGDPFFETEQQLASALLCRAAALLRLDQWRHGIRDCRAVLALQTNQRDALFNLILAHTQQGRFNRAAVWLRRARQAHPHDRELNLLAMHLRRARIRRPLHRLYFALRRALTRR